MVEAVFGTATRAILDTAAETAMNPTLEGGGVGDMDEDEVYRCVSTLLCVHAHWY